MREKKRCFKEVITCSTGVFFWDPFINTNFCVLSHSLFVGFLI